MPICTYTWNNILSKHFLCGMQFCFVLFFMTQYIINIFSMSAYILFAEECLAVWDLRQIIINIDFIACVSKIFRYNFNLKGLNYLRPWENTLIGLGVQTWLRYPRVLKGPKISGNKGTNTQPQHSEV